MDFIKGAANKEVVNTTLYRIYEYTQSSRQIIFEKYPFVIEALISRFLMTKLKQGILTL